MFLFDGGSPLISRLFHTMDPFEISVKPDKIFRKVDLPAPDGPTTA